jgi:hypothetical protein
MPTAQKERHRSSQELLQEVSQLCNPERGGFVDQVLQLRAQRRAPHLPKKESELLLKINAGLPEATWRRQGVLDEKRRQETLTSAEHRELIALNDEIEEYGAWRIGYLAELARLRQTTLDDVMRTLGIGPRRHA